MMTMESWEPCNDLAINLKSAQLNLLRKGPKNFYGIHVPRESALDEAGTNCKLEMENTEETLFVDGCLCCCYHSPTTSIIIT